PSLTGNLVLGLAIVLVGLIALVFVLYANLNRKIGQLRPPKPPEPPAGELKGERAAPPFLFIPAAASASTGWLRRAPLRPRGPVRRPCKGLFRSRGARSPSGLVPRGPGTCSRRPSPPCRSRRTRARPVRGGGGRRG